MSHYEKVKKNLINNPKTWLITGVAGFIGSNLLESLLRINQKIIGLDNLSTGRVSNLEDVKKKVSEDQWKNFEFNEGDLCNLNLCQNLTDSCEVVLHQGALGSVTRSIKDPINTNLSNVSGFLNILNASLNSKITSFVYASSSSVYGDHKSLPRVEKYLGNQLSPYAVSKYVNEIYADVFFKSYGFSTIGLRYFNVFGKRQNPDGEYAAVIPKWIECFKNSQNVKINGDGKNSRDFCYIENVIQINILAAMAKHDAKNKIYNVACGEQTNLITLFDLIKKSFLEKGSRDQIQYELCEPRKGDIKHSLADISAAKKNLKYSPEFSLEQGLAETISWYLNKA